MSADFGEIGNGVADITTVGYTAGQRAAKAQGKIAEAQFNQETNDRNMALRFAEPSPQELAQLERGIAVNEKEISRKQALLESADPVLIESGKQALQLLRGEEAKTIAPLRNNIAKQEQALRAKLQAQLGPGYENTTAGIQALQAFNEQANGALADAQQKSLGQLLGVAQNTSNVNNLNQNIANAGTLGQLFGKIGERQVNALASTKVGSAGSQFVGGLQSARANTNMINTGIQVAGMIAGIPPTGGAPGAGMTGGDLSGGGGANPYTLNSGVQINGFRY